MTAGRSCNICWWKSARIHIATASIGWILTCGEVISVYDANDLVKALKQAAVEAVAASCPVMVCTGKVTGVSPLEVQVGQKVTLAGRQIIRCGTAPGIGEGSEVVLLREQGGQRYVILGEVE